MTFPNPPSTHHRLAGISQTLPYYSTEPFWNPTVMPPKDVVLLMRAEDEATLRNLLEGSDKLKFSEEVANAPLFIHHNPDLADIIVGEYYAPLWRPGRVQPAYLPKQLPAELMRRMLMRGLTIRATDMLALATDRDAAAKLGVLLSFGFQVPTAPLFAYPVGTGRAFRKILADVRFDPQPLLALALRMVNRFRKLFPPNIDHCLPIDLAVRVNLLPSSKPRCGSPVT